MVAGEFLRTLVEVEITARDEIDGVAVKPMTVRWLDHGAALRNGRGIGGYRTWTRIAGGMRCQVNNVCAPPGTRTPNPLIKSQLLCQLS